MRIFNIYQMGSPLSKSENCMVWCGVQDDSFSDQHGNDDTTAAVSLTDVTLGGEVLVAHSRQNLPARSPRDSFHKAVGLAPSTNENLRRSRFEPHDVLLNQGGMSNIGEESFNPTDAEVSMIEEPRNPTPVITRSLLMRESPGDGEEDGVREGVQSFFHSDGDELVEDTSWSRTKRGPSLAELLRRVEHLGNVDLALSEIRNVQNEEGRSEATVRNAVLERFLLVMGSEGPGLAVKKCRRGRNFGTGGVERGKWAARTIRFEPNDSGGASDGVPLGGVIVWNSKRLFPREQRGVRIADIVKVEHSGKCVWVSVEGEGKLGFETISSLDARFLCRSIDFLIAAAVQHDNLASRDGSKTSSIRSSGTDNTSEGQPLLNG